MFYADDWDGSTALATEFYNAGAAGASNWWPHSYHHPTTCWHCLTPVSITRKEYKALRKAAKRDPEVARALDRLASKMELSSEIKFWDLVPD